MARTCEFKVPIGVCAIALLILTRIASETHAQGTEPAAIPFTSAQAALGKVSYAKYCGVCHGDDLTGIHLVPSLIGGRFDRNWRGKSLDSLAFHLRRMPMKPIGTPGSLDDETYTDLLAYLLASNGFPAGSHPLPADTSQLEALSLPRLPGSEDEIDAPVVRTSLQQQRLDQLPVVTEAMLNEPAAGDWLYWGRTRNGHGYSPLDQINPGTVGALHLAWRTPLRAGGNMPTPLVNHGVMYLHTFPDTVLAIDAVSGDVLWRYQHEPQRTVSTRKMGLGLHGDKVLVPTSDLHVLALHARTGELIWDHTIAPETPAKVRGRYQLRSAPFIAGDKVVQGVTASSAPGGGFILAIDIQSGKAAWKFHTIARPDQPGGNSWNGLPLEKRSGGSVWHQGTYDPQLNLVYFGVAPTYDTGPLLRRVDQPGVTNDALYTNCTLAIDADRGELVWHYQHMPNDQWDLDWVFERQIVMLPINGADRKVVINIGKIGILEALDAATGEYLFSIDAGLQNVITRIDPATGEKTYNAAVTPNPSEPCTVCPSAFGARSWPPTSFDHTRQLVYAPLTNWCMRMGEQGLKILTSGVGLLPTAPPDHDATQVGRLQAYDIRKRKLDWAYHQSAPWSTSTLATGGGLVFAGDLEPSLKAFDSGTGKLLWRSGLDELPSSSVITFSVNQKQYVSVIVGRSNRHIADLNRAYQVSRSSSGQQIETIPNGGSAIWTFALRKIVRDWKLRDLVNSLNDMDQGRSFANGQRVFRVGTCQACHRTQDNKASIAPSLTQMSEKISQGGLDRVALLREILRPSDRIAPKYRTQIVTIDDGSLVSGVVLDEDEQFVHLLANPLNANEKPKKMRKSEIVQRIQSTTSLMPTGLLNTFGKGDILDLLAYIEAGGSAEAPAFSDRQAE